jgi:hypothetical protein
VVFAAILGTGTGAGIAVHGRVLQGPNGLAGEWGHNPLPWGEPGEDPPWACYCGQARLRGEAWSAARASHATTPHATAAAWTRPPSPRAPPQGDADCQATLQRHTQRLARALAGVINLLDPDVIVLGGGLSRMAHLYTEVPSAVGPLGVCRRREAPVHTRLLPAHCTVTLRACGARPGWGGRPAFQAPRHAEVTRRAAASLQAAAQAPCSSLAVFGDQRLGAVQQGLAVEAAFVHVRHPFVVDGCRTLDELLRLGHAEGVDGVLAVHRRLAPRHVVALLHLAQPGEVAMPELASMTFFRSGARPSYLALFMAITKVVVYSAGMLDGNSLWNLVSSCTFTEGTTSQGMTQPSMVPLLSASGICGSGMPTGVAPRLASSLVTWRVGPRTFRPRRSATVLMGLLAV